MTGLEIALLTTAIVEAIWIAGLTRTNRSINKILEMEKHNLKEMYEVWKQYVGMKGELKPGVHEPKGRAR